MSGVIYKIETGDGVYVGSTNDYKKRIISHKSCIYNENSKHYNSKLYKTIRANDGDCEFTIYEDNLSTTKDELRIREEEVRVLLGATLNSYRAITTDEQKKQQMTNADIKKADKVTCECGCVVTRGSINRHKRTAKHARLMTSPETA